MTDKTVRPTPARNRMKTLTQAALNADKTVEQVEDVLDGLGERIDYFVGVGETVMSPLSVTEYAVRGVFDRLRNRTAQ